MSLPREILDQLLSGYLDDTLSADERARVERLLVTEPEFASELEELRSISGALKEVARTDSVVKLPKNFSDQVLDAAIAAARSEGLSDDHPLIRVAEQPSVARPPAAGTSVTSWRTATAMLALAASIVIAVFAFRPETNTDGPSIAGGPGTADVAVDPGSPVLDPRESVDPEAILDPEVILDPDGGPSESVVVTPSVDVPPRQPESILPSETPEISDVPPSAIVVSDPAVPSLPEMPLVASNAAPKVTMRGEILLLDVRRTAAGRQSNAVQAAMRAAGITAASEKQITEEVVSLVKDAADQTDDEEAIVLYLQTSAKAFDQFIFKLIADEEGIESVGFTIAVDAPILGVVQSIQPIDPTKIRHAATWELAGQEGVVSALAGELGQRKYATIEDSGTAEMVANMATATANSNGPDILSQVLVLIR